jgi:uncharacterized protein DUF4386
MTIGTIDESQRKAATVAGFSYLFALPPAIFAEFYVRTQLIAFDNAAQTARNIMAHERLFRLGTASNLTVFAVDVVLIVALEICGAPIFFFELTMGFWLLLRGLPSSGAAPDGIAGQHRRAPFNRVVQSMRLGRRFER